MNNAKIKKALAAGLSVALVAGLAVAGTVSYYEAVSNPVTNNFDGSDVDVDLEETTGDSYNIIPGTSQEKDPKVTVNNSVDAYVYVVVTDNTNGVVDYAIDLYDGTTNPTGWKQLTIANGEETVTVDGVYYREVDAKDTTKEFSVLEGDKVTYPTWVDTEDIPENAALTFQAYAIQKIKSDPTEDSEENYTYFTPDEAYYQVRFGNSTVAVVDSADGLKEAISAGEVAVLNKNITANVSIPADTNAIIDLNSNDITNDTTTTATDTLTVANGATLTLAGDGTVSNTSSGKAAIYNNGTTVVEGGTYTTNSYYLFLQHGEMTINGGTFTTTDSGSSLIDNGYYTYSSTNDRLGLVEGKGQANPKLVINGGTFDGGLNTVKNDDGGILEINGGTFKNTTQHALLNWNVATINGGTFIVTGASYVVAYNSYGDADLDKGELTINGGTFISEQNSALVNYKGTLFINGGDFQYNTGYYGISNYNGTVSINKETATFVSTYICSTDYTDLSTTDTEGE